MDEHPYGWLSVVPPLLAITLAISTRRILTSLFAGTVCAAMIGADTVPDALYRVFEVHLWQSLIEPDHVRVFCFTLLMGAMVALLQKGGGMAGLVGRLTPLARGRRGGQLATWLMGLVIFFDDYANTLLLGSTLQPLTDRLKISREKLAYLVDSTAAPVAGLAIISTWIAGEIDYIDEGLNNAQIVGARVDSFAIFVATIPYRFYVLFALLMVPIIAILNRDFGPMLKAEQRCCSAGHDHDDAVQNGSNDAGITLHQTTVSHCYNAVLPIVATLA
ncbi:MAG: hypothetical protein KDA51_14890, partial [Planctomycetales bacterium]|nr:hypothetical protein [Planctomycetales bacterium]